MKITKEKINGEEWQVIKVEPGNVVICDSCNREPEEGEKGGCLVGSWFYCKECTKEIEIKYPEEITTKCPEEMTSWQWIMSIR